MTELIEDKKQINLIINSKIKNKKIIFTDYYNIGIMKRNIPHEKVLEIFPQFDKVFAIEKDTLKFGDIGYELFYKISNNISFSIGTCPKDKNILIIHAVEYRRSLGKRFANIRLK